MRSWSAPSVPPLPGGVTAPAVRLHDTASGGLVESTPADGVARMYVCGITPYDATHLGHAATFLGFDLLNRAWRSAGHEVRYVQNVTDVDDPLLERANATGDDWVALAERETQLFRDDMESLRILPPEAYVGAVEAIPMIVEMIQELQAAGAVYSVDDDLYFEVSADPAFGDVSHWTREKMIEILPERGGDPDRPGKRDPLDCLVWQAERPGEPSWDSPFGPGRPGWHVECSAIARDHLGASIDVQGGGSDLVFPHHEMSASEAHVVGDVPFARAYAHAGMVALDGEKMSKSKGNLVLVSKLRETGVDPMAIRFALLRHHYRSDWEWTDKDLGWALEVLPSLRRAVAQTSGAATGPVVEEVLAALADDLDAPRALEALRGWEVATNEGADRSEPGAGDVIAQLADAALGLQLRAR